MKTILLKLAGPLQSWGTDSHFESRHTDFYPSKSAIIGLIAASLGYLRNEDEKVQRLNELNFAVRVDQQGLLTRDYHVAHKYKSDGTEGRNYVTNRYYLEDAVFVVAVSGEENLMSEIEVGLRRPYFQPFMGRRSLPLPADFIIDITNKDLLESLCDCKWQASDWHKRKFNSDEIELEIYAENNITENQTGGFRKDRVISFSQKERKFGYRSESCRNIKIVNPSHKNKTEHNIWNSV